MFEFNHPNRSVPIDNNRYAEVEFKAKYDATIHGIGGYFDSHLYKNIDISNYSMRINFEFETLKKLNAFNYHKGITPKTHSAGLFSWFPMFFPLKVSFDLKLE